MAKKKKRMPKHWYKIYYGECPVCGKPKEYRERMYTPRPTNQLDRYQQLADMETYDWCLG